MCRTIVITSGKGGVGKSSMTINLGYALANTNKKVCLIDADFGLKKFGCHARFRKSCNL